MGKKYLDTKKNTLEDAVEQVWYQQHGLTNKETKENAMCFSNDSNRRVSLKYEIKLND